MNNTQEKVYDSADVLVVGGGFGGVCAAVAAARTGVSVILVERSANLGGQAAEIHTWGLDGFISITGQQLIRGIPWEILQKTVAEGGSDPVWSLVDMELLEKKGIAAALEDLGWIDQIPFSAVRDAFNPFNNNYINPNAYRYVCHTKRSYAFSVVFRMFRQISFCLLLTNRSILCIMNPYRTTVLSAADAMRRIMKCGTSLDVTDYRRVVKYRNATDISIPLKILKLNGESSYLMTYTQYGLRIINEGGRITRGKQGKRMPFR